MSPLTLQPELGLNNPVSRHANADGARSACAVFEKRRTPSPTRSKPPGDAHLHARRPIAAVAASPRTTGRPLKARRFSQNITHRPTPPSLRGLWLHQTVSCVCSRRSRWGRCGERRLEAEEAAVKTLRRPALMAETPGAPGAPGAAGAPGWRVFYLNVAAADFCPVFSEPKTSKRHSDDPPSSSVVTER